MNINSLVLTKPEPEYYRSFFLLIIYFLLFGIPLKADLLYLQNGNTMEGKVEKLTQAYRLVNGKSTFIIPFHEVKSHETKLLPKEEYPKRLAETAEDDFNANYTLALWCKNNGLKKEAKLHFQRVFTVNPEYLPARLAAGYRQYKGNWLPFNEYMQQRGLILYKGKWQPKAIAEPLLTREQNRILRLAAEKSARKILSSLGGKPDTQNRSQGAENLAKLGKTIIPFLQNEAIGINRYKRAVALESLALLPYKKAIKILCKRVAFEKHPFLVKQIALSLSTNPNHNYILKKFTSLIQTYDSYLQTSRLVYTCQIIADKKIIDYLLKRIEFLKISMEKENKKENKVPAPPKPATKDKKKEPSPFPEQPPQVKTIYKALRLITEQNLDDYLNEWQSWWQENKSDFKFPEPILARQNKSAKTNINNRFNDSLRSATRGKKRYRNKK